MPVGVGYTKNALTLYSRTWTERRDSVHIVLFDILSLIMNPC